jgi:hypothetical protein
MGHRMRQLTSSRRNLVIILLASLAILGAFAFIQTRTGESDSGTVLEAVSAADFLDHGLTVMPLKATETGRSGSVLSEEEALKIATNHGTPVSAQLVRVAPAPLTEGVPGAVLNFDAHPGIEGPLWIITLAEAPPFSGRPGHPYVPRRDLTTYNVVFLNAQTGEFVLLIGGER